MLTLYIRPSFFASGTDEFMWEYFYIERVFIVAFIAIFILFPLSITEKMQSLRFISLISIFSILGFIGVVVVYYFVGDVEQYQEGSITLFNFDLSIFSVLSTCTFAFACHTSLLPVSKGLYTTLQHVATYMSVASNSLLTRLQTSRTRAGCRTRYTHPSRSPTPPIP
jgi:amino acid permease